MFIGCGHANITKSGERKRKSNICSESQIVNSPKREQIPAQSTYPISWLNRLVFRWVQGTPRRACRLEEAGTLKE
jgi:hypothetical protein